MSVAFTKEGDAESVAADLPDRPISPHPNLVTLSGLALLDAALAQARAAYAAARTAGEVSADRTAMARATRDLRYCVARRGSAQLVEVKKGRRGSLAGEGCGRRGPGRWRRRRDRGYRLMDVDAPHCPRLRDPALLP